MNSTIAHPGHHHLSTTSLGLALAGAVLAVGAGYGLAAVLLDDAVPAAPSTPDVGNQGGWGSDPNGFRGTNREERGTDAPALTWANARSQRPHVETATGSSSDYVSGTTTGLGSGRERGTRGVAVEPPCSMIVTPTITQSPRATTTEYKTP